ncbi:MAG TPA: BamA/TamA family outer membrane protein [Bacteroidales bacterium]|nr:BamA/TamA family outer membrane protein [Bacteroidales bacterium]
MRGRAVLMWLIPVLLPLFLASCSVTHDLGRGESLLIRNRIMVPNHQVPAEELEPYLQQQPNKKLLGLFRANIAIYNLAGKGKETRFKRWLRNKVGSPPVILDTGLANVSRKQMNVYLGNKGFFHSEIRDSVVIKRKKATVTYRIFPSVPYRIRNLSYAVADTHLARFIFRDTTRCLVKRGSNFDSYLLDDERTRITSNLQNYGFFRFSTIYIKYTIDTNLRTHLCDVTLEVINRVMPSFNDVTTLKQVPHKQYFIDRVLIYPEYDPLSTYTGPFDTLVRTYQGPAPGPSSNTYYFLSRGPLRVKPSTIAQAVFVTPHSNYNLSDVTQSYSQLAGLQVFKYINIQFTETDAGKADSLHHSDLVDCHIQLSRSPAQSFSVTTDGTNSGGAFGVQGSVNYMNRNIFRGAQIFRLSFSGSLQMQATGGTGGNRFFNTMEFGVNAGITFPQFLLPVRPERMRKSYKPRTTINLGYNYQRQQHYDRHISNINFGYAWMQNEKIQHVINPAEVSLVKVNHDAYFDSVMNSEQDHRLKNQYTDHVVAGLKYTFTFNSQKISKLKDFAYIRLNVETGGNLIYAVNSVLGSPRTSEGAFRLLGLPYAQYARPDLDFRFYNLFPDNLSLVWRMYGGIGVPYGNDKVLPFEKTFFAGGANGMRGWRMYTLGPGSYHNPAGSTTFNQIGDMQIEANVEFRFPVYDWIRAAVFADAGNIWLLQESQDLPGGKFRLRDLGRQIALDAGIGIRLDFDFFVFRLDPAIRLRVPSYAGSDNWYFNQMQLKDIIWNFGIGYPF